MIPTILCCSSPERARLAPQLPRVRMGGADLGTWAVATIVNASRVDPRAALERLCLAPILPCERRCYSQQELFTYASGITRRHLAAIDSARPRDVGPLTTQ